MTTPENIHSYWSCAIIRSLHYTCEKMGIICYRKDGWLQCMSGNQALREMDITSIYVCKHFDKVLEVYEIKRRAATR